MDAWSAEQLKKMQAGGNDRLNNFFKQYGVDKYTDIRDKYNNRVAEVCKTGVHYSRGQCSKQQRPSGASNPRTPLRQQQPVQRQVPGLCQHILEGGWPVACMSPSACKQGACGGCSMPMSPMPPTQ
jgi:hypothetical protein